MLNDIKIQAKQSFERIPSCVPIEPFEVIASRIDKPPAEIIKLDANENPFGLSPLAAKALAELRWGNIYPDPESRALREALSSFLDIPMEHILAGAGADELIDLILRVIIQPGDRVLIAPPTFGMYAFDTRINGGQVIEVPRRRDFTLDLDEMERVVYEQKPRIVFLAVPNNPDGSMLSLRELKQIYSWDTLVVLDEAYIEFSDERLGKGFTQIQQPLKRDNVIVLRTFSKWAGLAGLRVGYGVFPAWILPILWKVKQPYNVNVAASAAALASLKDITCLMERVNKIRAEREQLFENLQKVKWLQPYPSQANFILCKVLDRPAKMVKEILIKKGIFVRFFDTPLLHNYIRISVGLPRHHEVLLNILQELQEDEQ